MKPRMTGGTVAQDAARVAAAFQQAMVLHQQGRPFQADALCAEVLRADPRHYGAWHLRGLLALESGNTDVGVEWIEHSLKIHSNQAAAHSNIGNALLSKGQPQQALASFDRALRLKSDYVVALYNRGNALRELRRFDTALDSYERVLRLQTDHVPALNNSGLALIELGRLGDALAAFDRAAELDPRFADAHRNRGAALLKLARVQEALECYGRLLQWAPKNADAWCGQGNALLALKRLNDALASYSKAIELDPPHVDALINRGHVLQSLQRPAASLSDYEQALRLAPDSLLALNNSGNALLEMGRAEAALTRYDRALELSPEAPDTLYNRGAALRELKRYEESAQSFADLLRIAPGHDYALGNLFHLRMDYCSWSEYESLARQLQEALAKNRKVINPLSLLLSDSPELQLACARVFVADKYMEDPSLGPCAPHVSPEPREEEGRGRRIRVAYVSADFCEHPVSHLLVGALERHDRERFEVIGVSLRTGEGGAFEQRVRGTFEHFIEVTERSDREVAELLRGLEVDIAVDLMGFTQSMRLGIFAHRCAPLQVNYLGYAGTLGAPYIDYLLADEVVIPAGEERWFSERVVKLPHCYLPNDDRREIGACPTRAQAGLPETGVVFCAFTSAYKINPRVFEIWMRLLREVPGSVLWLRGMAAAARGNLQREAQLRRLEPERLVFAPHVADMAEHLARQGLADLYLDTLPYNAHSTACDALWSGVPVLTCAGRSFAGRVAASALTAVGLPELITHSLEEYERKALDLAQNPEQLRALRAQLSQQRTSSPLFDTARFCRHLEDAYRTMHQRATRGEVPASFAVTPIASSSGQPNE
jgi:protein O-GlcNAc transferase